MINLTENLIPFVAKKTCSSIIWRNETLDIDIKKMQSETSYLIPDSEKSLVFSGRTLAQDEKIFYAERYGGGTISHNGGGARCGFDGKWQVKGIGINPLIGKNAIYVDGELNISEAIREIIWGSVMGKVLPFGATSNLAVLLTDQYLSEEIHSCQPPSRRTLLIRAPAIRPAHFCRAPYYRPLPSMASQQHDAERIKNIIKKITDYLPLPSTLNAEQWNSLPVDEKTALGLVELAHRLATQIAYCQSHHLSMTSSPSNCDIKGKLLDFHGITSIFPTDRKKAGTSYIDLTRSNDDVLLLLQGVLDICFYLAKYQFGSIFLADTRKLVITSFNNSYGKTRLMEDLCIAGFEREFLRPLCGNPAYAAMEKPLHDILNVSTGKYSLHPYLTKGKEHPAISLLHNTIDTSLGKNIKSEKAQKETRNEYFFSTYHELIFHYLTYNSRNNRSQREVIYNMKENISRRLQTRKFMTLESIRNEIYEIKKDIKNMPENIMEYERKFVKNALEIFD